jgi:hypothetical protein
MEITTSWMERGIERGRVEGEQLLVVKQLTRKFSDIPNGSIFDDLLTRVNRLDRESIESLGEALLFFKTPEDLINWLNENER